MKHGGKRAGAGRKIGYSAAVKKKRVSFALAPDCIEYLDTVKKPKVQVIEEGLRMHKEESEKKTDE